MLKILFELQNFFTSLRKEENGNMQQQQEEQEQEQLESSDLTFLQSILKDYYDDISKNLRIV